MADNHTYEDYKCDCLIGFTGKNCTQSKLFFSKFFNSFQDNLKDFKYLELNIKTSLKFNGDGHVELPNDIFNKHSDENEQDFELEVSTYQSDGLILWKQEPNVVDVFELRIKDGHLIYR